MTQEDRIEALLLGVKRDIKDIKSLVGSGMTVHSIIEVDNSGQRFIKQIDKIHVSHNGLVIEVK